VAAGGGAIETTRPTQPPVNSRQMDPCLRRPAGPFDRSPPGHRRIYGAADEMPPLFTIFDARPAIILPK
jgi:hypothetical protein